MVFQIIVYTYKNAAVQRAGDHYSAFGIRYNKKTKRLYGSRGGGGGIKLVLYAGQRRQPETGLSSSSSGVIIITVHFMIIMITESK